MRWKENEDKAVPGSPVLTKAGGPPGMAGPVGPWPWTVNTHPGSVSHINLHTICAHHWFPNREDHFDDVMPHHGGAR